MKLALKLVATIAVLAGAASCDESEVQRKAVDYEILIFALSWPISNCYSINNLWKNADERCSPCRMPDDLSKWTIHGLWPSNRRGQHPKTCSNAKFNKKLLGPQLEAKMEQQWPTMSLRTPLQAFWSHEWSKHGTCAGDLESASGVANYFAKCLELHERYELGSVLAQKNVVPGRAYDFKRFYAALSQSLGVNVFLHCKRNNQTKQQYVTQVNICLNKSFEPIDCDGGGKNISNCKRSDDIFYPKNLKSC